MMNFVSDIATKPSSKYPPIVRIKLCKFPSSNGPEEVNSDRHCEKIVFTGLESSKINAGGKFGSRLHLILQTKTNVRDSGGLAEPL
jgi:hypothetical protein